MPTENSNDASVTQTSLPPDATAGTAPLATQGVTPSATGATPTDRTDISALPPDVQAYIGELRKEAQEFRHAKKRAEEELRKAEEAKLVQQQEWQTLANQRQARLDELEPVREQYEEIRTAFDLALTNKLNALPEETRKKLEPVRASMKPVEYSKWLDTMIPELLRKAPNLDAGAGGTSGKRPSAKENLKFIAY